MQKLILSLSVTAIQAMAQNNAQQYQRFADTIKTYGYTWEAIPVKTEDGYTLTTFHITGNADGPLTPTKPPVLFHHGGGDDGVNWLGAVAIMGGTGVPMQLQLAEAGYDVYIGNNRGTEYSQVHDTLNVGQKEFWAFSWQQMGQYDVLANLKTIKDRTSQKSYYVGYSQGTMQMFYALANYEDQLDDLMLKFVALAPCTITSTYGYPESGAENSLYKFPSIGVHQIYGPGYWTDEYLKLAQFGQEVQQNFGQQGVMPVAVQSEIHIQQVAYQDRFQEYAPNYLTGDKQTKLIDLSTIDKIPIALIVGGKDALCTPEQAKKIQSTIGAKVTHFETVETFDHAGFWNANDESFMSIMTSQLSEDGSISNLIAYSGFMIAASLTAIAF